MKNFKIVCLVVTVMFALTGCMYINFERSSSFEDADGTNVESSIKVVNFSFSKFFKDILAGVLEGVVGGANSSMKVVETVSDIIIPDESISDSESIVAPFTGSTIEILKYHGRTNGTGDPDDKTDPKNRPTWYGEKDFSEYLSPMRVVIQGCFDEVIGHNGVRYYPNGANGLLVKQSDVVNRGIAVLYSDTCKSKTATIQY